MNAIWKQNHPERAVTPSHTSRDKSRSQEAIIETTNVSFLPLPNWKLHIQDGFWYGVGSSWKQSFYKVI